VTVARQMQITPASTVVVLALPRADELDDVAGPLIAAALEDRLAWIAYSKGRQVGTDLNRDVLAKLVETPGAQPVPSVSIDGCWASLRFRPL
jgi:hypothetical protein